MSVWNAAHWQTMRSSPAAVNSFRLSKKIGSFEELERYWQKKVFRLQIKDSLCGANIFLWENLNGMGLVCDAFICEPAINQTFFCRFYSSYFMASSHNGSRSKLPGTRKIIYTLSACLQTNNIYQAILNTPKDFITKGWCCTLKYISRYGW